MPLPRAESERLRDNFANVLRQQALEASQLATLAGDDADVRDAVTEMLDRVQRTAQALQLDDVEQAASNASRAVSEGAVDNALGPLLALCRALDPTALVLRPVLVIGVTGPSPDPLLRIAPTLAEALADALHDAPLAVVVPSALLAELPAGGFGDAPVYAWGPEGDLTSRLDAANAGAAAFFPAPLDLRTLGGRVRARALHTDEPDRVLLVGASEAVTFTWVRALAGIPAELTVLHSRDALLATLDDIAPSLIVLADPRAADVASVLRGHPDWWDLARVVVTDEPAPTLVELTLATTLSAERIRAQVRALLEHARVEREQRAQERFTDVLPRAALLRAAEREAGIARRTRQPLAVARVDVDEPAALRRAHGSAAVGAALRLLARSLREIVRTTDVVGRVGDHGYGVLLPGATRDAVRARLTEVEERFRVLAAADPRLVGVTATAGISDNAGADDNLFQLADRDRIRVRRG